MSTLLLKNRAVARFIIAPSGYGKTSLAIEYAETMFSWSHVFWINGKSPCLIRDLDSGALAEACFQADPRISLVVFDDVPALDGDRAERLSREIDALLAGGCEVVVTCTPSCAMVAALQRDCVQIGAVDLLLDDDELDKNRSADDRARRPAGLVGRVYRIPAIAWADDESSIAGFARQVLYEEVPSDLLAAMASALVLHCGALEDLQSVALFDQDMITEVANDYPHLGFGQEIGSFEAPPLPIDALAVPLKRKMDDLVARSVFSSVEQLVCAWADILLRNGRAERACDLVRRVCPRHIRSAWLLDNAYELVRQACFYPVLQIVVDRDGAKGRSRVRLGAFEALCRRVLGDEEGAVRCAKRHAFDHSAPLDARVSSLLVMARSVSGILAERAREALEDINNAEIESSDGRKSSDRASIWSLLVEGWCARERGLSELADFWVARHEEGADGDMLCICASWMFGLLEGEPERQLLSGSSALYRVESFVRQRLGESDDGRIDYFSASAGLSMEEAHMRGVRYEDGPLSAGVLIALRRVEVGILSQRRMFEEAEQMEDIRRIDWIETHPGVLANRTTAGATSRKCSIPILRVRLFGRFEVMIGDELLDQGRFSRQNTRVLLALLAVNQGRDVSREALAKSMWPRSPEEVARKNFYTVWSQLRRSLSLPDGTCPYLLRHQFGCSLEPRYVQSDASRLSEICRELMFGVPNIERWAALFSEVDQHFSNEFMPAEFKNPLIVKERNEYRSRLVDALVAATVNAIDIESPQWGIWFARAALTHDETREDVYVALMRAQIASSQRTAAMATYLKCRRALSDQLGIDPAAETTRLYEDLLNAD